MAKRNKTNINKKIIANMTKGELKNVIDRIKRKS